MPSNDSFRQLINLKMKQVPVLMNGPLNHWLKLLKIQKRESFINKTLLCVAQTDMLFCCDLCLELSSLTKWSKNSQCWQYIFSINSNWNIELKCILTTRFNSCITSNLQSWFSGNFPLLVVSCCLTRLYVINIKTKLHLYVSSVCSCVCLFWFLHKILSYRQAAWASTGK